MKKLLVLIIFLVQLCFSQREANIWHFGNNAGIDFNSCEPVAAFSNMDTSEGCTSISDNSGQLQFYTNGTTIWNRNHITMSNGTGLLGHRSATQSSMIIKRPGSLNEYFVFTIDEVGKANGLMYSEVDMDGDGGLGNVTAKNTSLINPVLEKIHAVRHSNGEDVWVSVHGFGNNNFYSFLVTSAGVNPVPVTTSIGPNISGANIATIGAMKFSPNGRKLAICNYETGVGLYDFDNSSGFFSNPVTVTSKLYSYGVEFSKSSNILYVGVSSAFLDINNKLLQYNLNASVIEESEVVLFDFIDSGGIGSLQLGPDKRIYVSIIGRGALSVINEPNNYGDSCDFIEDGFNLQGTYAKSGLPLFLFPIFHNEIVVEDTCFGDVTSFSLSEDVGDVIWDFGDPASGVDNTAADNEPYHLFSAPGVYTVTTNIVAGCGATETITKQVEVFDAQKSPSVQLIQCDDNADGYSAFNLNDVRSKLSSRYLNEAFNFYRTEADAISRVNNISPTTYYENVVANSDSVWLSVGNSGGCYDVIEVNLVVSETTIFDSFQPIEFSFCDDEVNDGVTNFDFSNANSSIEALFPGQAIDIAYFRSLEDALSGVDVISDISSYENIGYPYNQYIYARVNDKLNNDCLGIGNLISLTVMELPQFDLTLEAEICLIDSPIITLEAYNPSDVYSYQWTNTDGEIISSDIDAIVSEQGVYTLVATSSYGCESIPKQVEVSVIEKIEINSEAISINDGFGNNTITINEQKLGTDDYEYALGNAYGVYQEEPFFENLSAGVYTVYVRGKNSCKPSAIEVSVIGFPKFFTPNNDSQNDTWNIIGFGSTYVSGSKISIYNRYGKLIKRLKPGALGWDGTFNGNPLPNSDYWFVAQLINYKGETRILKGHFVLKR